MADLPELGAQPRDLHFGWAGVIVGTLKPEYTNS